jgi:NAD(P)-dependent dehydrogenase (short-subunit alcohol dehydrogenase family)
MAAAVGFDTSANGHVAFRQRRQSLPSLTKSGRAGIEESIWEAIPSAACEFEPIDVLLNNAGFGVFGLLEATSVDTIGDQFDINVVGRLATTKALLHAYACVPSGCHREHQFGGRPYRLSAGLALP